MTMSRGHVRPCLGEGSIALFFFREVFVDMCYTLPRLSEYSENWDPVAARHPHGPTSATRVPLSVDPSTRRHSRSALIALAEEDAVAGLRSYMSSTNHTLAELNALLERKSPDEAVTRDTSMTVTLAPFLNKLYEILTKATESDSIKWGPRCTRPPVHLAPCCNHSAVPGSSLFQPADRPSVCVPIVRCLGDPRLQWAIYHRD